VAPFLPKLQHTKRLSPDDGTWFSLATGLRRLGGSEWSLGVSRIVISTMKGKTAGNN
jgi:hypothetical protein